MSPFGIQDLMVPGYELVKQIGSGEYGNVFLAIDKQSGIKVAIKIISTLFLNQKRQKRLRGEIAIMLSLNHPNVIKTYGVHQAPSYTAIIMQYAQGGDIFEYSEAHEPLSQNFIAKVFSQLLDALNYLHNTLKVVHRDLKLVTNTELQIMQENILLDDNCNVLISDFGFANTVKRNGGWMFKTTCGSPIYAAPELILRKKYDGFAADLWSCGVILYALLTSYLPFEDYDLKTRNDLMKIYQTYMSHTIYYPETVHPLAKDLISGLLETDPLKRLSLNEAANHPWISEFYHHEPQRICPKEQDRSYWKSAFKALKMKKRNLGMIPSLSKFFFKVKF